MKNLISKMPESIEELPTHSKILSPNERHTRRKDYPYNKVNRFLMSRVGKNWNRVFSEYVHLEWVPVQYRTREQIGHIVVLNTFLKDGEVWFYDQYFSKNEMSIGDIVNPPDTNYCFDSCFYIDPNDFTLRYAHRSRSRKKTKDDILSKTMIILGDYHQLLKIRGIWYEVKGEKKQGSDIIEIDGLHWRKVDYDPINEFCYRFINGEYYIPDKGEWRHNNKEIGPRDRLIEDFDDSSRYSRRSPDYDTVKITLYRQLTHKELKHHGLRNDAKIFHRCPVCGGENCTQKHNRRCKVCGVRWCQKHGVEGYGESYLHDTY